MTKIEAKNQEKQEAINTLKKWIDLDDKNRVYTITRHVSQSGLMRHISIFIVVKNEIQDITHLVAKISDYPVTNSKTGYYALRVAGAGMDMGFYVVYNLSCALYCPEKYEHEAAYRLRQSWL